MFAARNTIRLNAALGKQGNPSRGQGTTPTGLNAAGNRYRFSHSTWFQLGFRTRENEPG